MAEPRRRAPDISRDRHGWRAGHLQYQRQSLPPGRAYEFRAPADLHQGVPDARRIRQRSVEKMATLTETAYGKLLSKVRPRVITTEAENERAIAELEALDMREALTPEEAELASLLTALIERF